MEIARLYSYFGDANLINTELDKYMKVKKEDLQKVAKKIFLDQKQSCINLRSQKAE